MSTVQNILDSHSDFVSRVCDALTAAHTDFDAILPTRTKGPADFARMRETASLLIDFISITSRRYNTLEQYSKALAPTSVKLAKPTVRFEESTETRFDSNRLAGFVQWVYDTKRRAEIIDRELGFQTSPAYAAKQADLDIERYIVVLPVLLNQLCDLVQEIQSGRKSTVVPTNTFSSEYTRRGPRPFSQSTPDATPEASPVVSPVGSPVAELEIDLNDAILAPVAARGLRRTRGHNNLRTAYSAQ
ncbi:uncharacterized protein LOC62_02G002475 [Vanrija pseudolonga]|uniref:Uncharacterized protein n=1 Tax=Vanrija pseudolonga TaxID=143232 RepID=A0AAF0Y6W3_9TREE|nr:hypothetical protein LOC62_02G002475 [Vanrija pseudolonga]